MLGAALAAASVFIDVGGAHAQSARDADFAAQLYQKGYEDLAEEEARRIEADGSYDTKTRGDAGYLYARMLKVKAQREGKTELLEQYKRLIDELKKKYPEHSASKVAGLEQLQAQLAEAETLFANARDETEPAKAQEMRARAIELFQGALERFDEEIVEIQKGFARNPSDDLQYKRDLAEYLRANAYFTYALTLEPGARERTNALDKARELFASFFDERTEFFHLWTLSFLGRGKAELELGKFKEATETFLEAGGIEAPFKHPDPAIRKQMEDFVRDARAEGYYWLIVTQVRSKSFNEALEAADAMEKEFPDFKRAHFGRLAILERGKAYAGLERYKEAGEAIYEVVEMSMRNVTDHFPGYDIDRYGVSAAKALAEIVDTTPAIFPAPVQYRAGQGFFFRQQWEKATWAFKQVLVTASTDEERELWGARALIDTANCYLKVGRVLEAAITYQGLYRLFPGNDQSGKAMALAKQIYGDLAKETKSAFYQKRADEVAEDIVKLAEGPAAEREKYKQAVEWQRARRYVDAAEKFLSIEKEVKYKGKTSPIPFYAEAIANAGYCYYLAHLEAAKSPGKGGEHLKKALDTLKHALDIGRKEKDLDAWAAAAYFLSRIHGNDKQKQWDEALAALEPFDDELAAQKGFLGRALGQRVYCYIQKGQLDAADAAFTRLEEVSASGEDLVDAAFYLGDAFGVEADHLQDEGKAGEAALAREKAAKCLRIWVTGQKDLTFRSGAWAADIVFRAGDYGGAKAAYESLFKRFPAKDKVTEEDRKAKVFEYAQLHYALALSRSGDNDKAIAIFEEVKKEIPRDFLLAMGYAETLNAKVLRMTAGTTRDRMVQEAYKAYLGEAGAPGYYTFLRQAGEEGYAEFVQVHNLPKRPYATILKEVEATIFELQLALKQYGEVLRQIQSFRTRQVFDDVINLQSGGQVVGQIVEEDEEKVVVLVAGEKKTIAKGDVARTRRGGLDIERFPPELRKRFDELEARAKKEGKL